MSKRQLRAIVTLAIVGLACAPRPARAQYFHVGTLTKPAATGVQTVAHGLPAGVTPTAMIFWTSGSTTGTGSNSGAGGSFWWSFGVTDGTPASATGGSRSASASSRNTVTTSSSSRRSAAQAITIVQYAQALQAEADLRQPTPWDTTNFYMNWTNVTNTSPWIIHFVAIGGPNVQAQVVEWTATASGSLIDKSVPLAAPTFSPSVVLNFMDYDVAGGGLPSSVADAAFMLGEMDAGNHQWATAFYSKSGQSSGTTPATTLTARAQRIDAALEETDYTGTAGGETLRAHWVSMDAAGFTVHFDKNSVGAHRIFSLAMTGVNLWGNTFNRNTPSTCNPCSPPVSQPVPMGAGFTPGVVLLAGFSDVAQAAPEAHGIFSFGASDGGTEGVSTLLDISGRPLGGSNKTGVITFDYTSKVLEEAATGGFPNALADLATFDAVGSATNPTGGFTLSYTVVANINTDQMLYLALGPLDVSAVTLTSFTATRLPDGKMRLEWHTGYEVDNVGFRVYREQNGQRVRITSSLVPGTALIGIGRGASLGDRTYSWSDATTPTDDGPVQYWLEDVDRHGKSTWHGPIVAGMAGSHKDR